MPTRPNKPHPNPPFPPPQSHLKTTFSTTTTTTTHTIEIMPSSRVPRSHPPIPSYNFSSSEKVSSRAESCFLIVYFFISTSVCIAVKNQKRILLHDLLHISTAQNPSSSAIAVVDSPFSSLSNTNQTKSNPSIDPSRHPPPMPTPPADPLIPSLYLIPPKSRPLAPFLSSFKNHQDQTPPHNKNIHSNAVSPHQNNNNNSNNNNNINNNNNNNTTTQQTPSLPIPPTSPPPIPIPPKPHPPTPPTSPPPPYPIPSNPIKPHPTPLLEFPFSPSSTTPTPILHYCILSIHISYTYTKKKKSFSKSPKKLISTFFRPCFFFFRGRRNMFGGMVAFSRVPFHLFF